MATAVSDFGARVRSGRALGPQSRPRFGLQFPERALEVFDRLGALGRIALVEGGIAARRRWRARAPKPRSRPTYSRPKPPDGASISLPNRARRAPLLIEVERDLPHERRECRVGTVISERPWRCDGLQIRLDFYVNFRCKILSRT